MYTYTENNPVMRTDPTGYCSLASNEPPAFSFFARSRVVCGGARNPIAFDKIKLDYIEVSYLDEQLNPNENEYLIYNISGYDVSIIVRKTVRGVDIDVDINASIELLSTLGGIEKASSAIYSLIKREGWSMQFSYNRLEGEIGFHHIAFSMKLWTKNSRVADIGLETGFRLIIDTAFGEILGHLY